MVDVQASGRDSLIALALVGTGQAAGASLATGAAVDDLPAPPGASAERALLLRAGALAVYGDAGYQPERGATAPEFVPENTRPPCASSAIPLLESLFTGQHTAVLAEALARLDRLGLCLPFTLLPLALSRTPSHLRPAAQSVLGARGRWLAQWNPAWKWATEGLDTADDALPGDAEQVWQEGIPSQRVEVLRRLRVVDPAQAREWLEAVWRGERGETRGALLGALEIGLGLDDEPLLERALDDRAEKVRSTAADLLTRLSGSAYVRRMMARADALLTFDGATLDVNTPHELDAEAKRDGLADKPPAGMGQRAFRLRQVLQRTPSAHWRERFGPDIEPFIQAALRDELGWVILQGITWATVTFGDTAWAGALWRAFLAVAQSAGADRTLDPLRYLERLAPLIPEVDRTALAIEALTASPQGESDFVLFVLGAAPTSWSEELADAYLELLFATMEMRVFSPEAIRFWTQALEIGAIALPASRFDQTLAAFRDRKASGLGVYYYLFNNFSATVRLRQRVQQEITA